MTTRSPGTEDLNRAAIRTTAWRPQAISQPIPIATTAAAACVFAGSGYAADWLAAAGNVVSFFARVCEAALRHRGDVVNQRMYGVGRARRVRLIGFLIAVSQSVMPSAWAIPPPPIVFTVNTSFDSWDDSPGDGSCDNGLGFCTLRAAVMEANRSASNVTIVLPADTYTLTGPVAGIDEYTGDLNLTAPAAGNPVITITGAGAATTIIDANGKDRVLTVSAGRTATIGGVTLRNGSPAAGGGGGIQNHGVLTLTNVVVRDNHNNVSGGGGIYSDNQLGIYSSTITLNVSSADDGGGIENENVGSGLTIVNSTIDRNVARDGGGLYNGSTTIVMVNSTVSENAASRNGGGIYSGGGLADTINIYNSTIVGNEADSDVDDVGIGAGIYNEAGATLNLRNSVVAGNYLSGAQSYDDCTGVIGMYGNNKFSPTVACTVAPGSPGTATTLDSVYELGILQDNGGATRTHAIVPPSSLIHGGMACVDQISAHLATDQRGRARPPSPPNPLGSTCDIGAFEYNEIFASGFE